MHHAKGKKSVSKGRVYTIPLYTVFRKRQNDSNKDQVSVNGHYGWGGCDYGEAAPGSLGSAGLFLTLTGVWFHESTPRTISSKKVIFTAGRLF